MDLFLMFVVVISASFSIYYSFKTRSYRKEQQFDVMKWYNAKTNIAMGILLISMGIIQTFTFPEPSGWRLTVGIVFLILGAFNFYMGIKNYRFYLPKTKHKD